MLSAYIHTKQQRPETHLFLCNRRRCAILYVFVWLLCNQILML